MRRFLLIVLIFSPALLAAWFFSQSLSHPTPEIETIDPPSRKGSSNPLDMAPLAGESGKDTFFLERAETRIEGRNRVYPRIYYHIRSWRREEGLRYAAKELLAVINPRPVTLEDLESLLVLDNDASPGALRQLLEKAGPGTSVIRAPKATILGGNGIDSVQELELDGGFSVDVGRRKDLPPTLRLEGDQAKATFDGNELDALVIPKRFEAHGESLDLSGQGLVARRDEGSLLIRRQPRIEMRDSRDGRITLEVTAAGAMRYVPEERSQPTDLLQSLRLSDGILHIEDDVRVRFREFELKGDSLDATLVTNAEGRTRLTRGAVHGHVVLSARGGTIRGEQAVVDVDADGAFVIHFTGNPVDVSWNSATGDGRLPSGLTASCTGPLVIHGPAEDPPPLTVALTIRLEDDVAISLARRRGRPLTVTGESMTLSFGPVPSNRAAPPKERFRYELLGGVLDGDVQGRDSAGRFDCPRLELERRINGDGLLQTEIVRLRGPAAIRWKDPKTGPTTTLSLEAARVLRLEYPASPFVAVSLRAEGEAIFRRLLGDRSAFQIMAGVLEASLTEAKEDGTRELRQVEAKRTFLANDDRGSTLRGDSIVWRHDEEDFFVQGAPAQVHWVDALERPQSLEAPRIRLALKQGSLVAESPAHARLRLPSIVPSASRRRAIREAERELTTPPRDVTWVVDCRSLDVSFTDVSPFAATTPTDSRPQLKECTLSGSVRVACEDQDLEGENLIWDERLRTARLEGAPLQMRCHVEGGENGVTDVYTSRIVTVHEQFSVFEGGTEALIHVTKPGAKTDREPLFFRCRGPITVRSAVAILDGPTLIERGPRSAPRVRVESGSGVVRFETEDAGLGGFGRRIASLIAEKGVKFKWNDLDGEGESMELSEKRRRIWLEGKPPRRCRMRLRGNTMNAPRLVYDMDKNRIDVWRPSGGLRKKGNR